MSSPKRATRRLSLMTSSSLIAAGLAAIVSTGATLAPTSALAQSATCVAATSPAIAGNGTSAVTLPGGTYNPGILCNYVGDTATVTTSGAITVSTSGGVPADPLVNGINLRATGTNDVTWVSTAGTVTGGAAVNGAVIDAATQAGNIVVTTGTITASSGTSTSTHGILARSTAGGNVSVTTTSVDLVGTRFSVAGVEAGSTGGDGDVTITGTGSITGRLYGIRAETSGAGDLTIDVLNALTDNVNNGNPTSAGLFAKTGTGLLRIDVRSALGNTGIRNASGLRIETGGDAIINLHQGVRSTGAVNAAIDMTTAAGTLTQLNIVGSAVADPDSTFGAANGLLFRGAGEGDFVINMDPGLTGSTGGAVGRVDFSSHTGDLTWNLNEHWMATGVSTFGAGNATVTVADGMVWTSYTEASLGNANFGSQTVLEAAIVLDFGAGDDTFVNHGSMLLGPKSTNQFTRSQFNENIESETRFVGLDTFENNGTIYFGGRARAGQAMPSDGSGAFIETDGIADDVLMIPGAHFVGGEGSRLVLDAFLNQDQSACDVSQRNTATVTQFGIGGQATIDILTGDMPATDCLGIQGGSTEGVTQILLNQAAQGDRGGALRIVLVDVAGGTSEAGHFVLDPANLGYNPEQGGYLDLGYIIMPLVYDAEAQQHVLLGVPGQNAWQTSTWAAAALEMWRTSAGSWLDRQADLRGALPDGLGGGIWLRTSADFAERNLIQVQSAGTSDFVFDNSYEQSTYAVTGGVDLISGAGADSAWVVGLMAGYSNAELEYGSSPNTTQFDSWNGGVYASFLTGGLYVDAQVSGNKADVKGDVPGLNLFPSGTLLDTRLLTVGAQIEGGWRMPFAGGAFIEPLAGVSYVQTKWDDLLVPSADTLRPGIDVEFDDPTSLRANIGARLGIDQDYGAWRAQYSVLGRVWNEFEGEHSLILHNVGEDIFVGDELAGEFSEFSVSASLYGLNDAASGFASVGGKWGDDYESLGGSVGVRVAW